MSNAIIKNKRLFYEDSCIEYGSIALLLLATFVAMGYVILLSQSGIDLTDEGFYLNTISFPSNYAATVTQFGFIYHPIYLIADGDVATLRRVNYLLTYGIAVLLCFTVVRNCFALDRPGSGIRFLLFSIVIAISSLLLTCFELPQSPSYNTLAFQSLLMGATGISLSHSAKFRVRIFGCILIGFSLWLAFMAKPTTALALGFLSFFHFVFSEKSNKPALLIPATTAFILLLIFALAIDGSVTAFANRLLSAIDSGRVLGAGNTLISIWRWDDFPLSGNYLYILIFLSLALAFLMFLCSREGRISRIAIVAICATSAVISIGILFNYHPLMSSLPRYAGLQLLALPAGCLIFLLATNVAKRGTQISRDKLILAVTLSLLPFAYAFGTDRPYWLNAEGASFFWVLSGLVLVSDVKVNGASWRILFPVSGLSILLSSLFIFGSIEYPMRQLQSLRVNADWISVGKEGNQLTISSDLNKYIGDLRRLAADGGFKAGTPVIDLTGSSPGVAYILNGTAPGAPWLLGGYPGSEAFATAMLDAVSCNEIARSWVLTSPNQAGRLPSKLLERYGISLDHDYEDLGFATRPPTPFPQSYAHHLLKPRRTHETAISKCEIKLQERSR